MTPADDLALRSLVARYTDAVNCRDEGAWAATWDDAGVWQLGANRIEGRDLIVATWRKAMAGFEGVVQLLSHGTCEVDGTTGRGRWTLWELGAKDGVGSLVVGCYLDRYAHGDAGWRFAERRFDTTYRGPVPLGAFSAFPAPATG